MAHRWRTSCEHAEIGSVKCLIMLDTDGGWYWTASCDQHKEGGYMGTEPSKQRARAACEEAAAHIAAQVTSDIIRANRE